MNSFKGIIAGVAELIIGALFVFIMIGATFGAVMLVKSIFLNGAV